MLYLHVLCESWRFIQGFQGERYRFWVRGFSAVQHSSGEDRVPHRRFLNSLSCSSKELSDLSLASALPHRVVSSLKSKILIEGFVAFPHSKARLCGMG